MNICAWVDFFIRDGLFIQCLIAQTARLDSLAACNINSHELSIISPLNRDSDSLCSFPLSSL